MFLWATIDFKNQFDTISTMLKVGHYGQTCINQEDIVNVVMVPTGFITDSDHDERYLCLAALMYTGVVG
jgi:hypothetical protein